MKTSFGVGVLLLASWGIGQMAVGPRQVGPQQQPQQAAPQQMAAPQLGSGGFWWYSVNNDASGIMHKTYFGQATGYLRDGSAVYLTDAAGFPPPPAGLGGAKIPVFPTVAAAHAALPSLTLANCTALR